MPGAMSEVRLEGVRKRYPGVQRAAVERLDITFADGEMAVLVGPSGCGKSTTLRIVAGLEEPTAGRVFIGSRDVTQVPPAERDIAMVFQSYALYPHMSVFDNLAFALRLRKVRESEIRERVHAVAETLAIGDYLDRKPKNLSGGQRQRVAIGRAVIRDPAVFLFDEPLSNLDAKLRSEMRREIARIHQRSRTTSLYVTHDQIEAMTLADRIVVLDGGVVQQIGTPLDVYDRPANRFVAGFFGSPAMNILKARIAQGESGLTARGAGFELELPRRLARNPDVLVGIRPEAIALDAHPDATPLDAAVELREVVGSEAVLHLRSAAGELTVRAEARRAPREGENVTLWLDPGKVHWFDAESEQRL